MKKLYNLLMQNKWEILLTICLFSNLYPDLSKYLYYVLWLAFLYAMKKMGAKSAGDRALLAWAMIGVIFLSTFINMAFMSYRWIMMCLILYITLCKTSYRFYRFKERFLFVSLFGYIFTGLLNNYAHHLNINYRLRHPMYEGMTFTIDFSGFTVHQMWLSAACGIGMIFLTYWLNYLWNRGRKLLALCMLPMMFLDLQTLVWGGSRSALGICIGASLLLLWFSNKNIGKSVLILSFLAITATIITPILMSDSERMQTKVGGMEFVDESGRTSRSDLWNARLEEFRSSPLLGVGFAVTGIGDEAVSGRAETGSGWLTVLSQTGLVGFILVLLIVKCAYVPLRMLRGSPHIALYMSLLAYLCLHTAFEAYLFQSGWYLCFVLWLTVSILDDYKKYSSVKYQRI